MRAEDIVESECSPIPKRRLDIRQPGEADDARKGQERAGRAPDVECAPAGCNEASCATEPRRALRPHGRGPVALRGFLLAQPADSWRLGGPLRSVESGVRVQGDHDLVRTRDHRDGIERRRRRWRSESCPGARRPDSGVPGAARGNPAAGDRAAPLEGDDLVPDQRTSSQTRSNSCRPALSSVDGALASAMPYDLPVAGGSRAPTSVHVTLARLPGTEFDNVALATLVIFGCPDRDLERARRCLSGVDGGTAAFISGRRVEGARPDQLSDGDVDVWSTHVFERLRFTGRLTTPSIYGSIRSDARS